MDESNYVLSMTPNWKRNPSGNRFQYKCMLLISTLLAKLSILIFPWPICSFNYLKFLFSSLTPISFISYSISDVIFHFTEKIEMLTFLRSSFLVYLDHTVYPATYEIFLLVGLKGTKVWSFPKWNRPLPKLSMLVNGSSIHIVSSVQFSPSVVSDSLWSHESQHARPLCPSQTLGIHSNSCPSSRWCHLAISSSVVPFFSCPQSVPASGSFPMSQLFAWGGQNIGVSASASVLPMNTQDWSPLGWTGWISLQSKGLWRVFSNTTVQKHQFFGAQLSSQSNSHIHTWPLEKP